MMDGDGNILWANTVLQYKNVSGSNLKPMGLAGFYMQIGEFCIPREDLHDSVTAT